LSLASDLGTLAFVRAGDLDLLDVRNCSLRTLVAGGGASPLRWSADGHYLAFSNGSVGVLLRDVPILTAVFLWALTAAWILTMS